MRRRLVEGLSRQNTKAGRLQRACLDLICEHEADWALPTSGRFLFYELVSRGAIPKTYPGKRQPHQDVTAALTHLREAGIVPWDYLVDETRTLDSWSYAPTVYEYIERVLPSARIDLWDGSPPPLILCESRSLAGVLREIARAYLCPIASTNGQAGGFLHTSVGPLLGRDEAPRRVLYLGDLDLSGGHIEENTRAVLSRYGDLDWRRLAVTHAQVREHGLTEVEKWDKRFKPARVFPAVETEALRQSEIQRLVTTELEEAAPEPLDVVRVREERQRVQVQERLRGTG
jgi:hypothetical protein